MADALIEGNQGEDEVAEEDFVDEENVTAENAPSLEEMVDVVEGNNQSAE